MNYTSLIGFSAAILTTVAFLPQVIQAWKTKSTKDVSLLMFAIFSVGIFLWLIWGILIMEWPAILANAVSFILALAILFFKLKYH